MKNNTNVLEKRKCQICGAILARSTKTQRCNKHKYTESLDPKIRIPIQILKEMEE